MEHIIEKIFFSIFIIAILVFFDILIKFKRPFILKYNLLLIVSAVGFSSLIHSIDLYSLKYVFYIIVCKALVVSAFLNVFSILYFPKFKLWVMIISFLLISLSIFSFYYNATFNPGYVSSLKTQTLVIVRSEKLMLPFYLKILRFILISAFFTTFLYFLYKILTKYGMNNIYFDKVKTWTSSIFIMIVLMLIMYIPFPFLKNNFILGFYISSFFYAYILIVMLYRPVFLNKSSMKIALGSSFNKNADLLIKDTDFIQQFFTYFYFTNPEASIENFSTVLNVGSNDLYKYVYYKYNMTFNDLVNKHRVEYFIDIIHNPKYLNFTIDALAKEAGFSSRQHLYKPFKKFHGGNPSDLIDSIVV